MYVENAHTRCDACLNYLHKKRTRTTADIWSTNHKSYLDVTVHWLDTATLQRFSAALACERMKGRHTYDVIAARSNAVHTAYRINNEVIV